MHPDVAARVSEIFRGTTKSAHAAACRALGGFEVTDRLRQITVPTLVMVGEEDYATPPEMSKTLHAGIPGSRLVVLPDARHLSMVESRQGRALAEQHLFT